MRALTWTKGGSRELCIGPPNASLGLRKPRLFGRIFKTRTSISWLSLFCSFAGSNFHPPAAPSNQRHQRRAHPSLCFVSVRLLQEPS